MSKADSADQSSGSARASHTPGPWTWTPYARPGAMDGAEVKGEKEYICAPYTKANARLIAAAPELLEACDEALNALIGSSVPAGGVDDRQHLTSAKASLRAAIKKARG